jgi:hypothetical protein
MTEPTTQPTPQPAAAPLSEALERTALDLIDAAREALFGGAIGSKHAAARQLREAARLVLLSFQEEQRERYRR